MPPPFEAPADLRFTCTRCGDCCRGWNVMLGPGEEERLRALDWRGREADLVEAETVVAAPLPGGGRARRLARRDDGACVYLGADSRCRIHQHFGGLSKPLMCQLYPFGFYPVGDRLAVDCSFACRSISQGSGAPLAERFPEWAALLAEGEAPAEGSHRLDRRWPLTGALLWELEHALLALLGTAALPLFDRVRCCLQLVRLATSGDPATASAAKLRQAIAAGLPRQIAVIPRGGGMDRTQRAVFYQWLFLALNPLPTNADLLAGPARKREEERRVAAGRRFAERQGAPWVESRELAVGWETIDAVDAALVAAPSVPLLERYLSAKVVGQRFLVAGGQELPFVEAVPLFLLAYPMAIWTSRALAAGRGAGAVEEGDLRRALGLLDRTLGQVSLAALPGKVAKAFHFVVEETDLVVAATNELLGWEDPEG
jgi:Fe-S-cluster containining protein